MNDEIQANEVALLSVKKVAVMLDLSVRQIWRLVSAKEFPQPVHVGHAARWRSEDVKKFLESLK